MLPLFVEWGSYGISSVADTWWNTNTTEWFSSTVLALRRTRNKALQTLSHLGLQVRTPGLRYKSQLCPFNTNFFDDWSQTCYVVRTSSDVLHPGPPPKCWEYRNAAPCGAFNNSLQWVVIHLSKLLTCQNLSPKYSRQIILNGTRNDAQQDLTFIEKWLMVKRKAMPFPHWLNKKLKKHSLHVLQYFLFQNAFLKTSFYHCS